MEQEITLQLIDGIYDIQPLSKPPLSYLDSSLLLLGTSLLLSISIYLLWCYFFSRKAIARRQIKTLYSQYIDDKINPHDTVYQMCYITKQGLKLSKLNNTSFLPVNLNSKKKEWCKFINKTSVLRYKKESHSRSDINHLFIECLYWLKVWP